jgi:RNA polymerase sigma factor (TIGR02999 family)
VGILLLDFHFSTAHQFFCFRSALNASQTVAGAVEMWESRRLCEISKAAWKRWEAAEGKSKTGHGRGKELRRIARRYMKNERPGNTLQTTALVNEVYLRLVDVKNVDWQHRAQFFAISAQMMRRILVDAARARGSRKRGGGAVKVNVDETAVLSPEPDASILALDEALEAFSQVAPRQAKVVELRYFGGLSEEEIAEVLKISARTVRRDWDFAKSWLTRELNR